MSLTGPVNDQTLVVMEGDEAEDLCIARFAQGASCQMPGATQPAAFPYFLTFRQHLPAALSVLASRCLSGQELLSAADAAAIDAFALRVARTWYRDENGKDWSEVQGVSLGLAWEWRTFEHVLDATKDVVVLERTLDRVPANNVLLAGGQAASAEAMQSVCRRRNVNFAWLPTAPETPRRRIGRRNGSGPLAAALRQTVVAAAALASGLLWTASALAHRPKTGRHVSAFMVDDGALGKQLLQQQALAGHCAITPIVWGGAEPPRLRYHFRASAGLLRRGRIPVSQGIGEWRIQRAIQLSLRRRLDQEWRSEAWRERFLFHGTDLLPALEAVLQRLATERLPALAARAAVTRHIMTRHRVRALVVSFDYVPLQRMLVQVARSVGVPSVLVSHGLNGNDSSVSGRRASTYVAAWGTAELAGYASADARIPPPIVTVCGHPKVDGLPERLTGQPAAQRKEALGLAAEKPLVLFAAGGHGGRFEFTALGSSDSGLLDIEAAVAACRGRNDVQLLVKVHPNGDEQRVRRLVEPLNTIGNVQVVKTVPIEELLPIADVVVARASTVNLQALAMGIPVVTLKASGGPSVFPDPAEGVSLHASSSQELTQCLDAVLSSRTGSWRDRATLERFLERHAGPRDGRSLQRIAALVAGVASERHGA